MRLDSIISKQSEVVYAVFNVVLCSSNAGFWESDYELHLSFLGKFFILPWKLDLSVYFALITEILSLIDYLHSAFVFPTDQRRFCVSWLRISSFQFMSVNLDRIDHEWQEEVGVDPKSVFKAVKTFKDCLDKLYSFRLIWIQFCIQTECQWSLSSGCFTYVYLFILNVSLVCGGCVGWRRASGLSLALIVILFSSPWFFPPLFQLFSGLNLVSCSLLAVSRLLSAGEF